MKEDPWGPWTPENLFGPGSRERPPTERQVQRLRAFSEELGILFAEPESEAEAYEMEGDLGVRVYEKREEEKRAQAFEERRRRLQARARG